MKKSMYTALVAMMALAVFLPFEAASQSTSAITESKDRIGFDKVGNGPVKPDPPTLSTFENIDSASRIDFYPNPCQERLMFKLHGDTKSCEVSIFDLMGNKVQEATLTPASPALDVSRLQKGMYILHTAGSAHRFEKM